MERRVFLRQFFSALLAAAGTWPAGSLLAAALPKGYDPTAHAYSMGIDVGKCIGCGLCMQACKRENDVPDLPYYFRTWVERYVIKTDRQVLVSTVGVASPRQEGAVAEGQLLRSFFVPKLCNQCDHPPCVQVCPVGATFKTADGVVLVDEKRCIGCRYCIQACPYGARYLHPRTRVADKCTFCYHRLVRGLLPACVEVCPRQARLFGDTKSPASPLGRFTRANKIHVLKPYLNTEPKVYYANLDGEVN